MLVVVPPLFVNCLSLSACLPACLVVVVLLVPYISAFGSETKVFESEWEIACGVLLICVIGRFTAKGKN